MSHCNVTTVTKCLKEGVDGAIVFFAENATEDPLGYIAKINGVDFPVTAEQEGEDVALVIPLVNLNLSAGTYGGYFETGTKTEGLYFDFKIRLDIIKSASSE